jgi:RNA polymerase sigma factor for flagellar operon FliA
MNAVSMFPKPAGQPIRAQSWAPQAESSPRSARRNLSRREYDKYLPLVRRTAIRVARKVPSHITVADLVSYGWVGLLEAFARADAAMPDDEFEAYASYRVRGAMLDYLRGLDPVSRETRAHSRRISKAIAALTQELDRQPAESEIAARLGMKEEAYRSLLATVAMAGMARLEVLEFETMDLESPAELPDRAVEHRSLCDAIAAAIAKLPERLQQVLTLHYQQSRTFREIGAVFGVTESRVCQLHSEAMHRLRATVAAS